MTQTVVLVLNEREERKKKLAERVEQHLVEQAVRVHRLVADDNLVDEITSQAPAVVILDFVLGDVATGLDIIEDFKRVESHSKPTFLFLTDEPSNEVIISAFRLGAQHYLMLDQPDLLSELTQEVATALQRSRNLDQGEDDSPRKKEQDWGGVVALSEASKNLKKAVDASRVEPDQILLLFGPTGSGKNTLARTRFPDAYQKEIALALYDQPLSRITDHSPSAFGTSVSPESLHWIVTDLENDDGELLDLVSNQDKRGHAQRPHLSLCCSVESIAQQWASLPCVRMLTVPALLPDRAEDFPILVQQIALEWGRISGNRPPTTEAEFVNALKEKEWPENVRQLRSVLFRTFTEEPKKCSIETANEAHQFSMKEIAETNRSSRAEMPDALTVAREFALNGHRLRPTALSFGLTVPTLRKLLTSQGIHSCP